MSIDIRAVLLFSNYDNKSYYSFCWKNSNFIFYKLVRCEICMCKALKFLVASA